MQESQPSQEGPPGGGGGGGHSPRARGRTHPGKDRSPGCPRNPGTLVSAVGNNPGPDGGEGCSKTWGRGPREIPTALPLSVPPGEEPDLPGPRATGFERLHEEGAPRAGSVLPCRPKTRRARGWGWGPVVLESSGSPGKHQRRTQDFQAPVRKREGRRPARGPSAPPRALRQSPRPETGESAPGSQASGGARRARSGRGGGSGATYGSGGEGGSGGPSAGPGRRGRTAEAPRLRRAGLRWAPSWSAPRARPAPPEPLHN